MREGTLGPEDRHRMKGYDFKIAKICMMGGAWNSQGEEQIKGLGGFGAAGTKAHIVGTEARLL